MLKSTSRLRAGRDLFTSTCQHAAGQQIWRQSEARVLSTQIISSGVSWHPYICTARRQPEGQAMACLQVAAGSQDTGQQVVGSGSSAGCLQAPEVGAHDAHLELAGLHGAAMHMSECVGKLACIRGFDLELLSATHLTVKLPLELNAMSLWKSSTCIQLKAQASCTARSRTLLKAI